MIGDERNFGILIAYIIPGWIGLLGLAYIYPLFDTWLSGSMESSPTVGGFLFAALASIALGTGLSTVRWLLLDPLVSLSLKPCPQPDFQQLRHSHEAMRLLIDSHYRYYQFHGNLIIAGILAMSCRWYAIGPALLEGLGLAIVLCILAGGARDTKSKYDQRVVQLLFLDAEQCSPTSKLPGKSSPKSAQVLQASGTGVPTEQKNSVKKSKSVKKGN